jgi:hypothetical protein
MLNFHKSHFLLSSLSCCDVQGDWQRPYCYSSLKLALCAPHISPLTSVELHAEGFNYLLLVHGCHCSGVWYLYDIGTDKKYSS